MGFCIGGDPKTLPEICRARTKIQYSLSHIFGQRLGWYESEAFHLCVPYSLRLYM